MRISPRSLPAAAGAADQRLLFITRCSRVKIAATGGGDFPGLPNSSIAATALVGPL